MTVRSITPEWYALDLPARHGCLLFNIFFGYPTLLDEATEPSTAIRILTDPARNSEFLGATRGEYERYIERYVDAYEGPTELDLAISDACNLGCHMCMHSRSDKVARLMSPGTAIAWIDFFRRRGVPFSVHFGAAEPLLNRRTLHQAILHAMHGGAEPAIMVNSNLTLLSDDDVRVLRDAHAYVNVGLDGLRDANDAVRCFKSRGGGTFELVVRNIARLVAAGVRVGVGTTVTGRNLSLIEPGPIMEFYASLGLGSVLVDIDLVSGLPCPARTASALLLEFDRLGKKCGIEVRGDWKAPFTNFVSEIEAEPRSFCAAVRGRNLVVTPDGSTSYCTYSSTRLTDAGGDVETTFHAFVRSAKRFMLRTLVEEPRVRCSGCYLSGACLGGCRITREEGGTADYLCEVYRTCSEHLITGYCEEMAGEGKKGGDAREEAPAQEA